MFVTLAGEVDLAVRTQLRVVLAEATVGATDTVTVDLGGLEFLDCSGIGVLVATRHELVGQNRALPA